MPQIPLSLDNDSIETVFVPMSRLHAHTAFVRSFGASRAAFLLVAMLALLPGKGVAQDSKPGATDAAPQAFTGAIVLDAISGQFRDDIRAGRLIEEMEGLPFNSVIVQVRVYADAYYDSDLVPRALGIGETFDPLDRLLKGLRGDSENTDSGLASGVAHRSVYVWFDALRVANVNRPVPVGETHVSVTHADWLTRNAELDTEDAGGAQYLEPGLDEVQRHLAAVVRELIGRYPVDGIIFGGLEYPEGNGRWGYHPAMIRAWREKTGSREQPDPADVVWSEMRRENIDRTLRNLARAARDARKGVRIGAFASAQGDAPASLDGFSETVAYSGTHQDWLGWMRDGELDFVVVSNHRAESSAAEKRGGVGGFDAWNAFAAEAVQSTGVEAIIGVAGSLNISLDVLNQIRRARGAGLSGVALSSYREPIQDSTARKVFFRALGKTELAPDAFRLPFPVREVAADVPSAPTHAFPPVRSEPVDIAVAESEPMPELDIPPPPTVDSIGAVEIEIASGTMIGDIDDPSGRARSDSDSARRRIIEPEEEAMQILKRRFPHIF